MGGPGLSLLLWLPDGACVFELWDRAARPRPGPRYAMLAARRGLAYGALAARNPAPPAEVVAAVRGACAAQLGGADGRPMRPPPAQA